jgi:hypothetical protein
MATVKPDDLGPDARRLFDRTWELAERAERDRKDRQAKRMAGQYEPDVTHDVAGPPVDPWDDEHEGDDPWEIRKDLA